jgi:hypothetical protein
VSSRTRARLFREVNERIYDLLAPVEPDLPGEFLCECGRDCGRRVLLPAAAFETLRRTGQPVTSPDCEARTRRRGERESLPGGIAVPS